MSDSNYNTYAGGQSGYQPGTSQYSSMAPRSERTRALIETGKRFVQQQNKQAKREHDKQVKMAAKGKNA